MTQDQSDWNNLLNENKKLRKQVYELRNLMQWIWDRAPHYVFDDDIKERFKKALKNE